MTLEYWYLFPISVLIATIAMATGIGGVVFFSPLFMLALRLEPSVAVGAALITELFGFSSGLVAYWKRRLIDWGLGRALLTVSVPAAIVGSLFADAFPPVVLKGVGFGLDDVGVTLGKRGEVVVNEYLQTANPDIYAAGDVTGEPMFVYVVAYGGTTAAENALTGNTRPFDLTALPKVTFTDPQVASVGFTEEEIRAQGAEPVTAESPQEHVPTRPERICSPCGIRPRTSGGGSGID